jgi:sarcosine oxidase
LRVAVIGAGIHGASTAWALSRRSHRVTLFEQFELGHDMGSSHGNSRIVRRAYPDAFYTEIMQEGYPLWHELEKISGKKLLHECGLLYFGARGSENVTGVIAALESLSVEHEVLDRVGTRKVFPELILGADEVGVFTPEAGWANASLAISTQLEMAHAKGMQIMHERVEDLDALTHIFDKVVVCAGPWIQKFVDLPVLVTLQTFGYISGEHLGPVWIEDGPNGMYGFPTEPWGGGIKAGVHYKDLKFDPDEPFRDATPEGIELLKEFAWRRLGMDLPRVRGAKGCLYTNTASEDFLLGNIGEQVLFVSACSGHGFKFGPWIGKTMADIADGTKRVEDFPRFAWKA